MRLTFIIAACLSLSGCAALKGFSRTYSLSIEGESGHKVSVGVKLDPARAKRGGKTIKKVNPPTPVNAL